MDLRIENQTIVASLPAIATDSIDFVTLQFTFDSAWDGLTKVAQFTQGAITYNVVLTEDSCQLPAEIGTGHLSISVFGQAENSAVRATTAPLYIPVRKSGFVGDGETPIPPTPDLYSQLLDMIAFGVDGKDGASAYEVAVANGYQGTEAQWLATMKGDTGEKGDTGADGADGATGAQGIPGADGTNGADGQDGADGLTTSVTLNGTTYTQENGNIDLGDVGGGGSAFDLVIRTQAEFEAMYASDTWLGAKSVCFVGDGGTLAFTRSDGMGLKIPQTVMNLQGLNGAKISVTNFSHNSHTNKAALWYATQPDAGSGYWIDGLEVSCTAGAIEELLFCYGFHSCTQLTNCNASSAYTSDDVFFGAAIGFDSCKQLTNCNSTVVGVGRGDGFGFSGCKQLINCNGVATSGNLGAKADGFSSCKQLINCNGVATSGSTAIGFENCEQVTNCTASGISTNGGQGFGFWMCSWVSCCKQGSTASTTHFEDGIATSIDSETVVAS